MGVIGLLLTHWSFGITMSDSVSDIFPVFPAFGIILADLSVKIFASIKIFDQMAYFHQA
jgi:hypothetical protein